LNFEPWWYKIKINSQYGHAFIGRSGSYGLDKFLGAKWAISSFCTHHAGGITPLLADRKNEMNDRNTVNNSVQ